MVGSLGFTHSCMKERKGSRMTPSFLIWAKRWTEWPFIETEKTVKGTDQEFSLDIVSLRCLLDMEAEDKDLEVANL